MRRSFPQHPPKLRIENAELRMKMHSSTQLSQFSILNYGHFRRRGRQWHAGTTREQPRALDDLGHSLLLAIGHNMDAVDTLDLTHLLDDLDADLLALLGLALLGRLGHALHHRLWNPDARHARSHEL